MPVTIQYYNDVLTDTAAILANLMQWRKKLEEKKLPGVFMQEFIQRYHVEEQKEDLLKAGEALDRLYIAVEEAAKDLPQSRLEAYFTPLASGQISVGEALARLIGLKLTPNDFPPEQRPQISIKTAAHILPQNDTPGWDDYPDYEMCIRDRDLAASRSFTEEAICSAVASSSARICLACSIASAKTFQLSLV